MLPSLKKFIAHVVLKHWMNPDSAFRFVEKKKRPFRVAIVTHGNFLKGMVTQTDTDQSQIYSTEPYFKPIHCQLKHYKPQVPAIGNVGTLTTLWTRKDIESKRKLPRVFVVYETNAVYDSQHKTCLHYDGKRFVKAEFGKKHHVARCHAWIRDIPTLK
jgi:hypothetical protein